MIFECIVDDLKKLCYYEDSAWRWEKDKKHFC